jgi:hypothetical protein
MAGRGSKRTGRRGRRQPRPPVVPRDAAVDVLLAAAPRPFQCLQCRALMQRTSVSIVSPLPLPVRSLEGTPEPETISESWRCPNGHCQVHLQRPLAAAVHRRRR